jgi:hypothetical protein
MNHGLGGEPEVFKRGSPDWAESAPNDQSDFQFWFHVRSAPIAFECSRIGEVRVDTRRNPRNDVSDSPRRMRFKKSA